MSMINNLKIFESGVLPSGINRYGYYPLDNEKILEVIKPELLTGTGSAVNSYNCLSDFMVTIKPIDVIEIGTFLGVGSALLASYSRSVFTFEIMYRNSHHIWRELEIDDRINCFCGNEDYIDMTINNLKNDRRFEFDFAFIDGMHKYPNVKHDFELVKFCGRVLFHDANIPEMRRFMDEIGAEIINADSQEPAKFAYWSC